MGFDVLNRRCAPNLIFKNNKRVSGNNNAFSQTFSDISAFFQRM